MNTVVTNLRIDESTYKTARYLAAECGVSVNEFVKLALKKFNSEVRMGEVDWLKKDRKREPIWDLPKLAVKFKKSQTADWSDDDRIIYDH